MLKECKPVRADIEVDFSHSSQEVIAIDQREYLYSFDYLKGALKVIELETFTVVAEGDQDHEIANEIFDQLRTALREMNQEEVFAITKVYECDGGYKAVVLSLAFDVMNIELIDISKKESCQKVAAVYQVSCVL